MTATFLLLLMQAMRHLRRWELYGRPLGVFLTRVVVVLLVVRMGMQAADAYRNPRSSFAVNRAGIVKQLEDIPGKHLVIVRYAPDHFSDHEWVYNDADIDASKIVWAREIPNVDMAPLLEYFRDRKVWLVQADHQPQQREEYRSPPGAIHASDKP